MGHNPIRNLIQWAFNSVLRYWSFVVTYPSLSEENIFISRIVTEKFEKKPCRVIDVVY